jgi:hypothetical protein
VTTGAAFQLVYSHLKRGSAKGGSVDAGDAVGQSGNTGRCVDGARHSFVKIAAKRRSLGVRVEEFTEPVTVEATLNGLILVVPEKVPPGEIRFDKIKLDRQTKTPDQWDRARDGAGELVVTVRRGSRTLARAQMTARME